MIVGREQGPAGGNVVQKLDHGPGNGKAVERGGTTADLIEDDQRTVGCLIEDAGRLHHLDHECGAAARKIIGSTHTREQPVDHADMSEARRYERPHLRQHGDQGVLAQERRFAGHVRAGDQPDPRLGDFIETRGDIRVNTAKNAVVLDEVSTTTPFE